MLRDMSHIGRYMVTNDGGPLFVNAAYLEKARRCFALRADMKPFLTNINDGDPNIHHQDWWSLLRWIITWLKRILILSCTKLRPLYVKSSSVYEMSRSGNQFRKIISAFEIPRKKLASNIQFIMQDWLFRYCVIRVILENGSGLSYSSWFITRYFQIKYTETLSLPAFFMIYLWNLGKRQKKKKSS